MWDKIINRRRLVWLMLGLGLWNALSWAHSARAQMQVTMALDKKRYVCYEPILATVQVTNRSGRDVILGSTGDNHWLNFYVANIGGDRILPYADLPRPKPQILAHGQSINQTVSLGLHYALADWGNYSVRAVCSFGSLKNSYTSNTVAFGVAEGVEFWKDQLGIPLGGGKVVTRQYSLLSVQSNNQVELYVRVRDVDTKRVLATYSLGRMLTIRDPQATLDAKSHLNVLFAVQARYYRHCVIDQDGKLLSEKIYKHEEDQAIPTMMQTNLGRIAISGGKLFDPNAPPEKPKQIIRLLTDRPNGIPAE